MGERVRPCADCKAKFTTHKDAYYHVCALTEAQKFAIQQRSEMAVERAMDDRYAGTGD